MNFTEPTDVAVALKQGICPAVPYWLLAQAAQLIADELAPATTLVTPREIVLATKALNAHCYFELTRTVAQAWMDRPGSELTIQKQLTQALINTGRLDAAEQLAIDGVQRCEQLASTDPVARDELIEYRGLLGRIAKQRFVLSGDRYSLAAATDQYFAEYQRDRRSYWLGINALACLMLENGGPRPGLPRPEELAREILATVTKSYFKKPCSWEAATASEANLALDNSDAAELWLHRFLAHEDSRPFNIDSFARQLREVWGGNPLSAMSLADRLSGIISRHLARAQARVTLAPSQIVAVKAALESNKEAERALEKNFLGESSFTVEAIRSLLKACASIGCVMNHKGERLGTGFLIRGSWFTPMFGDAPVFVTNAHVISDIVTKAIPCASASVTFELDGAVNGQRRQYRVTDLLYSSPPGKIGVMNSTGADLDCTIVRLDGLPAGIEPLTAVENLPLPSPKSKAFVAGHPRGAGLQIALHDSLLLDIDDHERLVHYRTPTDPGSSGSPVFNSSWEVIALHHAGTSKTPRLHGEGVYEANEGITLAAIRRTLNS